MAAPLADEADQRWADASRQHPPGAGVLGDVVRPFIKTGRYYTQSWRDYLDREPSELPIARPTIALATQAFRDEIAVVPGATHLFEEPGTLEQVAVLARDWFLDHLSLAAPDGPYAQKAMADKGSDH
jgi:hypothetical protein